MWFCFRTFLFHSIAHLFHLIDVELRTSQGIWSSKSPSLFFFFFFACLLLVFQLYMLQRPHQTPSVSSHSSARSQCPAHPGRAGDGWQAWGHTAWLLCRVTSKCMLSLCWGFLVPAKTMQAGYIWVSSFSPKTKPQNNDNPKKQIKISEPDTWRWFILKEFRQLVSTIKCVCAGIHLRANFTNLWINALYPFYS